MKLTRIVTTVLVTGSAAFGFLPIAQAADATQQTVSPSVEAWFQPNPTCQLPTGCLGLDTLPVQPPVQPPVPLPEVPLTAFPAGSMHVAVDAGQETARTYLSFSLPLFDATLTAASLDIPLDTAQADGSVTPESALIRVCSFQGSITAANGSIANPPTAACTASAKASYVPTGSPKLHVDLTPLLGALSSGAGLVLLPDADAVQPTDAWHVVFSAHDRADAAKTPPATMTVTLTPIEQPSFDDGLGTPPVVQPPAVAPPPALGSVTTPTVPLDNQPAPTVNNPVPQVPVQPVPQARTVTVGYAYPTVWLMPLAFLLIVPLVARTLTRDLTPVPTAG
jgi:hypothetical protein